MKKTLKWIAIIFITLIVLVAIFGGGDEDTKEVKSDATAVAEPAEEAIVVTANELFEAYQNNEVAADQKYKGKSLEVTGTVASIDSGVGDKAIVQLTTSNQFMPIAAQGDKKFTEHAATISKGDEVTLDCKGDGEVAGFVQLGKCTFK